MQPISSRRATLAAPTMRVIGQPFWYRRPAPGRRRGGEIGRPPTRFKHPMRLAPLLLALGCLLFGLRSVHAATNSITRPDQDGFVGLYTSLVLDANGFPVVSYYDGTNGHLKVLHCNDANCAGDDESITRPDQASYVGEFTSLVLDANGFPVVSYWDNTNGDLKVLHCNDANCAGDDESITRPDQDGFVGLYTSLVLDANGFPVVSYYDGTNGRLKVLHCNDANCAGDDESITRPDQIGSLGGHTSLALDANGFPVVSYYDGINGHLKVLHCNDANCFGDDESITRPDQASYVGWYTSLALDANGFPVVSHKNVTNHYLKVLHCNDVNCAGDDERSVRPDPANGGAYTSLALDANGFPVVSYLDSTNNTLKLLHCGTPTCDTTPPETTIHTGPSDPSASGDATFTFSGTDDVSAAGELTFECQLDGGGFSACATNASHSYSGLGDGSHTFAVRAVDAAGDIEPTPAEFTWTIQLVVPLYQQVQGVRTSLAALLPSGDSKTDKALQKAIAKLDQGLATDLWQADGNHLTLLGETAFHRLREAVKELAKLKNPPQAVLAAINTLLTVTRTLAETALQEAAAGNVKLLAKAQKEMTKAQQDLAKNKPADAMSHYEEAWEYAQEAVGNPIIAASVAPEDAKDADGDGAQEEAHVHEEDEAGSPAEAGALNHQLFLPLVSR